MSRKSDAERESIRRDYAETREKVARAHERVDSTLERLKRKRDASKGAPRLRIVKAVTVACLAVALGACGAVKVGAPPYDCGVALVGEYERPFAPASMSLTDLQRGVRLALDASTLTTDFRLLDVTENCRALQGWRVYTHPSPSFDSYGRRVGGITDCFGRLSVVGTPEGGAWAQSSLVHELFHVMQRCSSPPPVDPGSDGDHANWSRDGIFQAIIWSKAQ